MSSQRPQNPSSNALAFAKKLRKEVAPAEAILWKELRGRRFAGFKFRRQQPIDQYIVDFFCASTRLVIELDGNSHLERNEYDALRTEHLKNEGLRVIRFWNTMVYDDLDTVLGVIWDLCSDPNRSTANYPRDDPGAISVD